MSMNQTLAERESLCVAALQFISGQSLQMGHDFQSIEMHAPVELHRRFGHVLQRLAPLWGTAEASAYLNALMVADRSGRAGFNQAALSELFLLLQLHDFLHVPEDARKLRVEDLLHRVAPPRNVRELVERYGVHRAKDADLLRGAVKALPARRAAWGEITSEEELRRTLLAPLAYDRRRIGEILKQFGVISLGQLEQALVLQRRSVQPHRKFGEVLQQAGVVNADDVAKALCRQAGMLAVHLDVVPMTHEAVAVLPHDLAEEHAVVPLLRVDGLLAVAVAEPLQPRALKSVEMVQAMTGLSVRVLWAAPEAIARRLMAYVPGHAEQQP